MDSLPLALHFSDLDVASDPFEVGLGHAPTGGLVGVRAAGLLQPGPPDRPVGRRDELRARMSGWLEEVVEGFDLWLGARWTVPSLRARSFQRRLDLREGDWNELTSMDALDDHVFAGLDRAVEGATVVGIARVRPDRRAAVLRTEAWQRRGMRSLIVVPYSSEPSAIAAALAQLDLGPEPLERDVAWLRIALSIDGLWVSGHDDFDHDWHLWLVGRDAAIPSAARVAPAWTRAR